jgi:hypothetical protein
MQLILQGFLEKNSLCCCIFDHRQLELISCLCFDAKKVEKSTHDHKFEGSNTAAAKEVKKINGATTLSITTLFSIMTLSIKGLYVTLSINGTQHNNALLLS